MTKIYFPLIVVFTIILIVGIILALNAVYYQYKGDSKILGSIIDYIKDIFFPVFDEITLLQYGIIVFLTISFYPEVFEISLHSDIGILILFITAIAFLSIYNAFSKREKYKFEKVLMFIQVILTDFIVALEAYKHIKTVAFSWKIIFPFFNLLHASFILLIVRTGIYMKFENDYVKDRDANKYESILSCFVVILLYIILISVNKQHWAIVFSICIFYATVIHALLFKMIKFVRKYIKGKYN